MFYSRVHPVSEVEPKSTSLHSIGRMGTDTTKYIIENRKRGTQRCVLRKMQTNKSSPSSLSLYIHLIYRGILPHIETLQPSIDTLLPAYDSPRKCHFRHRPPQNPQHPPPPPPPWHSKRSIMWIY